MKEVMKQSEHAEESADSRSITSESIAQRISVEVFCHHHPQPE